MATLLPAHEADPGRGWRRLAFVCALVCSAGSLVVVHLSPKELARIAVPGFWRLLPLPEPGAPEFHWSYFMILFSAMFLSVAALGAPFAAAAAHRFALRPGRPRKACVFAGAWLLATACIMPLGMLSDTLRNGGNQVYIQPCLLAGMTYLMIAGLAWLAVRRGRGRPILIPTFLLVAAVGCLLYWVCQVLLFPHIVGTIGWPRFQKAFWIRTWFWILAFSPLGALSASGLMVGAVMWWRAVAKYERAQKAAAAAKP